MTQDVDNASAHLYRERLLQALTKLNLPASPAVSESLLTYLYLLERWNSTYNLTALKQREQMLTHHLFDCLAVVPALKRLLDAEPCPASISTNISTGAGDGPSAPRRQILDVGSGAGLPGLVLAMVWPDVEVTMIDAVAKKTAFQQHVIGTLRLANAHSIHGRIESYAPPTMPDLIICRAYASLQAFVTSVQHLAGEKTWLAAQKGRMDPHDPPPSEGWTSRIEPIVVPDLPAQRHLVVMKRA